MRNKKCVQTLAHLRTELNDFPNDEKINTTLAAPFMIMNFFRNHPSERLTVAGLYVLR